MIHTGHGDGPEMGRRSLQVVGDFPDLIWLYSVVLWNVVLHLAKDVPKSIRVV